MRRTLTALFAIVSVISCTVAVTAGAALAHASLTATHPPDGARLPSPPPAIDLVFSEPVVLAESQIVLFDATGQIVPGTHLTGPDPFSLRLELPALSPGDYVAEWEVQSTDTHRAAGLIRFSVAASTTWKGPGTVLAVAAGVSVIAALAAVVRHRAVTGRAS